LTIATDRLSKRHLQRALANARITAPRDAVDVGFLDEVVVDGGELDRAVALATELAATLDPSAYVRTVRAIRGPVLDLMEQQIASDRSAGVSPV
jgi:enoyl-CoA hydratase/carnithine racemase